ncbi:hypothetical protein GTP91_24340, partial [Rugamonas sp. FT82W]|nr:hypothetical protein [Duganella vulcania]
REARNSGVPLLHKPVAPAQLYRVLAGIAAAPAPDGAENNSGENV